MGTTVCKAHSGLPTSFYELINPETHWHDDTTL